SAVSARDRRVGLTERLKEPAYPVGRDPDAGVVHVDPDLPPICRSRHCITLELPSGDAHDDLAVLRELDGIGQEIEHDLAESADVADDGLGQLRLNRVGQLESFLGYNWRQQVEGTFEAR